MLSFMSKEEIISELEELFPDYEGLDIGGFYINTNLGILAMLLILTRQLKKQAQVIHDMRER